jgi:endonuclease YncB( thermonuclease family)
MKTTKLKAGLIALMVLMSYCVQAKEQSDSFDVLGSVMDTTKKEISAKSVLKGNKEEAEKFREKIISGWWEFMQASSKAKPGEYCAATFIQAKRDKRDSGVDLFKDGMAVALFGPGGDYRGALLGFMPISEENAFPKLKSGQKVLVTLKQGNEAPSTLNAVYMTLGKASLPMITFAVPNIEALMAGMEDKWSFEVIYQDKTIANIAWHSGNKARDELKKCLAGKAFDDKSHLKD